MNPWLGRRVLHFAHQGGELEAPSNTLFAFKTAVAKGAVAIETDVHATADGELVVMHDPNVDRTSDGTGFLDMLTLREIKQLDNAYWFVPGLDSPHDADDYPYRGIATGDRPPPDGFEPNDFTVPTLRELLGALPGVFLNMDIKRTSPETRPYEEKVAALLRELGRTDDVIVASFSDRSIARFREIAPEITTAAALEESADLILDRSPVIAYHALQVPRTYGDRVLVTPELVERAHDAGVAVHVWTVNDAGEMHALLDDGVDGIMTARPTVCSEVLAARGNAYSRSAVR